VWSLIELLLLCGRALGQLFVTCSCDDKMYFTENSREKGDQKGRIDSWRNVSDFFINLPHQLIKRDSDNTKLVWFDL
jgi:hypothetical protein